jgi:hypothetical protein
MSVIEKCVLTIEGICRSRRIVHGERVDDAHYAFLRHEWSS